LETKELRDVSVFYLANFQITITICIMQEWIIGEEGFNFEASGEIGKWGYAYKK